MRIGSWMKIAELVVAVTVIVSVAVAWRAVRRERTELRERLRGAEQELQNTNARQASRRVELERQLAEFRRQKAAVKTPDQVLKALPDVLPLPKPIVLPHEGWRQVGLTEDSAGRSKDRPLHEHAEATFVLDRTEINPPVPNSVKGGPVDDVKLPGDDLKPLYDFAVDCRACKTELAAAQADLADERTKTEALKRERDDALQVARGGSVMRRVLRAAKWFAIGAAAGAAGARLTH